MVQRAVTSCLATDRQYRRTFRHQLRILLAASISLSLSLCPANEHSDNGKCCGRNEVISFLLVLLPCGALEPGIYFFNKHILFGKTLFTKACARWFPPCVARATYDSEIDIWITPSVNYLLIFDFSVRFFIFVHWLGQKMSREQHEKQLKNQNRARPVGERGLMRLILTFEPKIRDKHQPNDC